MIRRIKYLLLFFLLAGCANPGFGQINSFKYKCLIDEVPMTNWYRLELNDEVLSQIYVNKLDLRVYEIGKDTVEIPYLLETKNDVSSEELVSIKIINSSRKDGEYYYTIVPDGLINQMELDIKQNNFDCLLDLEGSNDNNEWFLIASNYRIVGLETPNTTLTYTDISFPETNYKYLRIRIKSDTEIVVTNVNAKKTVSQPGHYKTCKLRDWKISDDKNLKKTIIDIPLKHRCSVSSVLFDIDTTRDFYRDFSIRYVTDSVRNAAGVYAAFNTLGYGNLTSYRKNTFSFSPVVTSALRVEINNQDNPPISVRNIEISGPAYEIVAQLEKGKNYFLTYGNAKAFYPNYDIENLKHLIPENPETIGYGEVLSNNELAQSLSKRSPLFENKLWLWIIIGISIAVLGFFTMKMMKS